MANTMILDVITAVGGTPVDSASAGAAVVVAVRLKNIGSQAMYIAVTGAYDSIQLSFSPANAWAEKLQTIYFQSSFIMPNKNVTVIAYGWWWDGYQWVNDGQMEEQLLLQAATPEFYDFRITQYQKL